MQALSTTSEEINFDFGATLVIDRAACTAQVWSDLETNGTRTFKRGWRDEISPRLAALGARHTGDWAPVDDDGRMEPVDVFEYSF